MKKPFFEVFEGLETEKLLKDLFKTSEVIKITYDQRTREVCVYIENIRLIGYKNILKMQKTLSTSAFGYADKVRIIDRYDFSTDYRAQDIFNQYRDDIELILSENGPMTMAVYKMISVDITEDSVLLCGKSNIVTDKKVNEIKDALISIFNDRFGFSLKGEIKLEKPSSDETESPVMEEYSIIRDEVEANKIKTEEVKSEKSKPAQTPTEEKKKSDYGKKGKASKDPSLIYGFNTDGNQIMIEDIIGPIGDVVIAGKVMDAEARLLKKSGKYLFIFSITDYTDSIRCKLFCREDEIDDVASQIKKGSYVLVSGKATEDSFENELIIGNIRGVKKIGSIEKSRMDDSEEKRVELHLHTKMSDMDGVSEVGDIVKRAIKWGHKAIAITDHGVVQAFPDAEHSSDGNLKLIFGCEIYLVDDVKEIVENECGQNLNDSFVVFDIETTGFGPVNDKIIEIGAVKIENGVVTDRFSRFINPYIPIPYEIEKLTGINDDCLKGEPGIETVLPLFLDFIKGCVLVAHNASFDTGFIAKKAEQLGIKTDFTIVDTVSMARVLLPHIRNFKLDTVAKELDVSLENHHRAVDDANATADIFLKFIEMLKEKNVNDLKSLNEMSRLSDELIKKMPTYHAIVLAKNDIGRVNLYKLVSISHLKYFARRPRIPKSLLEENREGLLIGSACEAGELYQAILRNQPDAEIIRLVNFYDYLEIQPLGNNRFMIDSPKYDIQSDDDLIEINKKIVKLGEEYSKPVVATCDVHFLDPEDEIYRRIIMAGNGFDDADNQAPLYLRTTKEMLAEFEYLGKEKAREVVITNTVKIADMIERISSVRPDKAAPVIENSDYMLRKICTDRAKEIYGEDLPKAVTDRLEHELHSIISNGFAVMYIIAQKLVWKSNEDGYLVGSRGSVGSSFAATMSGITEVNPLPAHYYCPNCHFSDFDSDFVKSFSGNSGVDMPDRDCPECGKPLKKEGHDIPFETFLGFYGDKEPDIDLNFSGEYQSKAHAYTEVIFGKGQTYRAGTIAGVAEKTAYGYVSGYYRDKNIHKRKCEIERIAAGCEGVKRTTGQHPGGIVVLPLGEDIYSFTPLQHPANDNDAVSVTTHFDYHKIDHNLLKLDILGHDDPTMIRMLEDITGLDAKKISLDDPGVLELFKSTDSLNLKNGELWNCDLGCLGVPEFGTDFVIQMLKDTKPSNFSELVRISGLSHGTDVWLGNASELIRSGICTLDKAICCRDDIMVYLIFMGLEPGMAFNIMENVRKGKVAKKKCDKWDKWKEEMKAHNVPDWYIGSCEKIAYMFPKAHAVAYVMMAFRIAYFKVYYPLAYYAAYFSIRAKAFSYEVMCQGKEKLISYMQDYEKRAASPDIKMRPSKKEDDMFSDMKIVHEMYQRGFDFMPIDIYSAKPHHFQIIDGKLMPSFESIDGLGGKAAESIEAAAKQGEFLSRDDFRERCKVSQTITDKMAELGLLGDLPASNQMSLMDLMGQLS